MAYISFQPSDHFNTKLYAGTGSELAVTGVGFQPDWTWIKSRSAAYDHTLYDVVRGATKQLYSNHTNGQYTEAQGLKSFDSDGFTNGTDAKGNNGSHTYVSWNWKAGNSQGSSNTDGSINTTYTSVNTTAGFSISQYTGTGSNATVGHGLGVAPKMIIIKCTSHTSNWAVYHKRIGATKMLNLNSTNAEATNNGYFNDTAPTSSVFSLGDEGNDTNGSGKTYIAYCFAEKKGFSKFGSYTGNGEASDNAFIYTGFKPAFVLIKATDVDEWRIYDNKRANPFNVIDVRLKANSSDAESSGNNECDFLSNGVKIRSNSGGVGSSGQTYIYMAFAEEPLVSSNNIPATAR